MPNRQSKKRLLILTLIFPPDGVSTAQLLGELALDLDAEAFEVSVLTTSPHYNVDLTAQEAQPISWAWHRLVGTSHLGTIPVTHVRMPQKAAGKATRAAQWLWFHLVAVLIGTSRCKRVDVVFTVSPPLTNAMVAGLLKRIAGAPFVFGVWELYPEILVALGKLERDSRLHRLLRAVERKAYDEAGAIVALHDPMRAAIASSQPSISAKVHTIPTFADTEFLHPLPKSLGLGERFNLGDRFVVGYAGNLGVAQDLSTVMEAAKLLIDDEQVVFLIAGDGSERKKLEDFRTANNLTNVVFTGHLPYALVPELTASYDLCIVTLAEDVGAEALPSKVQRIMACGRPILGVASAASPLADLIVTSSTGIVCPPNDPETLARMISSASEDRSWYEAAGARARDVAVDQFSRSAVTSRYSAVIEAVADDQSIGHV